MKQRVVYNVEDSCYLKLDRANGIWVADDNIFNTHWVAKLKDAFKYSMSDMDTPLVEMSLKNLATIHPDKTFEVHTYELIPKQYKRIK